MTTIDQNSKTRRTNQGLGRPIPYRRGGGTIVSNGQLSGARDGAHGDYAQGQRTYPDRRVVRGDFATGMRTISRLAARSDFATGMRTTPAPARVGDFATGMRTEPVEVHFLDNYIRSVPLAA